MMEYCGWTDEGDGQIFDGNRQSKQWEICDECAAQIPPLGFLRVIEFGYEAGGDAKPEEVTQHHQMCEKCSDLYDSLLDANHEPHLGEIRECASEAAYCRPAIAKANDMSNDPNKVCEHCRHFDGSCHHVETGPYEAGEHSHQINYASYDLLRRPVYGPQKRDKPVHNICGYWEA